MKPLTIFLFLFANAVYAQTNISGKIADFKTGQPVDYATISVNDQISDKVIDGTTADSAGSFSIKDLPFGLYQITVSFMGYNNDTLDSIHLTQTRSEVILPLIKLHSDNHLLNGVTITGNAAVVENKMDKIVYNAANDVTAQGGVALDVLKKVPQVSVDADGNVELQGSTNIRFLINGKPSSIFGNSLTDALSSIPASQIKSIEAITSPGAKYDAQGTGGIINIILKDNKMKGINGSVNVSAGTRIENGSMNLNVRSGTLGVNAFFSGNATLKSKSLSNQTRKSFDDLNQTNTELIQDGYGNIKKDGYMSGISMDWNPTKSDVVMGSFQYSNFSNHKDGITAQQQSVTDVIGNPVAGYSSASNATSSTATHSFDWSLDYKHKFKREGEEIDFNYYASYGNPSSQYSQEQTYANDLIPYSGTSSYNPGTNNQTNLSVDYVLPLHENFLLEAGGKTIVHNITSNTEVNVMSPSDGNYMHDVLQSYNLKYKMRIYAGYLSTSFKVLNFLDVKAGLRLEHNDINMDYANTRIPSYTTWVPSVILSHKITDHQFLKLAYSHRIERPDYEELNPFLNQSDPYNITTGNPLLQPEIGDNFELGYNHTFNGGANIYVAVVERINSNDMKPYTIFYPTYTIGDSVYNNVSISTRRNIGKEYNSGLSISGTLPLLDKLNLRGNLMLFNRHIVNTLDTVNPVTNGLNWRLNLNLSYELLRNLVVEAFGNYRSAFNNIQGKAPQFLTYTIAFRKQFWNKNASIGVTATNIFSNYVRQVTTINTGIYDAYNVREIPLRSVGITFTYKFGKLDFNKDKNKDLNLIDSGY